MNSNHSENPENNKKGEKIISFFVMDEYELKFLLMGWGIFYLSFELAFK